jgi:hypothetical protein
MPAFQDGFALFAHSIPWLTQPISCYMDGPCHPRLCQLFSYIREENFGGGYFRFPSSFLVMHTTVLPLHSKQLSST